MFASLLINHPVPGRKGQKTIYVNFLNVQFLLLQIILRITVNEICSKNVGICWYQNVGLNSLTAHPFVLFF